MRAAAILGLSLAALATSSPIVAAPNTFEVTNFVYGCTVTCDWNFDVTVTGAYPNHPPVTNPVHCEGSLDDTDFVECSGPNDTRYVSAYIRKSNNQLRLKYHVGKPKQGGYYEYFGHRRVNAATSGNPQASEFSVKESRAIAVA